VQVEEDGVEALRGHRQRPRVALHRIPAANSAAHCGAAAGGRCCTALQHAVRPFSVATRGVAARRRSLGVVRSKGVLTHHGYSGCSHGVL
jgi:hypothetical protein